MKRVSAIGAVVLAFMSGSMIVASPANAAQTPLLACISVPGANLPHDARIGPNESVQIRVAGPVGKNICHNYGVTWKEQILPRFDVTSSTGAPWPTNDKYVIVAGLYTLTPKPGAPFTTSMLKVQFGNNLDVLTITVVDPNNPDQPANPIDPDPIPDPNDDGAAISDGSSSTDANDTSARREQVLKRKLVLPSRVKVGVPTTLVPGEMVTNAGKTANVRIRCIAKDPKESGAPCLIVHGSNGELGVNVKRPGTHVIVRFTAPGTKKFEPLQEEKYTRSKK